MITKGKRIPTLTFLDNSHNPFYSSPSLTLSFSPPPLSLPHTGVVMAVEKRITSTLLEPKSIEKIMEIDGHIACAMSGLVADARTMISHARSETQNHRFFGYFYIKLH